MTTLQLFEKILEHYTTVVSKSPEAHLKSLVEYIIRKVISKFEDYPCINIEVSIYLFIIRMICSCFIRKQRMIV